MRIDPPQGEPAAGVLLVPKRWKTDEAALAGARAIAALGFACEIVELSSHPQSPETVSSDELASAVSQVKAAATKLRTALGGKKIGLVGAWLSGTVVMLTAGEGADACAVVSPLVRPVQSPALPLRALRDAKAPFLAVFGELDAVVPVEDIRAVERALSDSPMPDECYVYPGVGHAFFDKEDGSEEYHPAAERDLWQRIARFFLDRMGG